jgi:hypothetical protein
VGALEEYLNDSNFEQNRIEYKANKAAADRNPKNGRSVLKKAETGKHINWGHLIAKCSYVTACTSAFYPGRDGP